MLFSFYSLISVKPNYHKGRQQDEVTVSENNSKTGYIPTIILILSQSPNSKRFDFKIMSVSERKYQNNSDVLKAAQ